MKHRRLVMLIALMLLLAACAAGANPEVGTAPEGEAVGAFG